jgi:hypothetical protein
VFVLASASGGGGLGVTTQGNAGLFGLFAHAFVSEQVFKNGNVGQPRISAERLGLRVFQNPADKVYISILQPRLVLDPALPNDRLRDASDILLICLPFVWSRSKIGVELAPVVYLAL